MDIWFDGSQEIGCNLQHIEQSLENIGEHFRQTVSFMPGISSVEVLEQESDRVLIKTNEGIMTRSNIIIQIEPGNITVNFDEVYQAGKLVTGKSHYENVFSTYDHGIRHQVKISDVEASGFLGFFYRKFGSSNIGKAVQNSYKTYLEKKFSDGKAVTKNPQPF